MANELLGLDYVFAIIVELGYLRCPEIVAFDFHTMPDKEPVDQQSPLVRWVTPISRREHDLRVRRAHIILICFNGIDCLLINHDNARARFLCSDMQLEVAIFILFELRNEAKSQANNILYAESTRVEESDEGEDFRRLFASKLKYLVKPICTECLMGVDLGPTERECRYYGVSRYAAKLILSYLELFVL